MAPNLHSSSTSASSSSTTISIRLTEPYTFLVGGQDHERARARRRRALRQAASANAATAANAGATTGVGTPAGTPGHSRSSSPVAGAPGSRAPSPTLRPGDLPASALPDHLDGERGRSTSRSGTSRSASGFIPPGPSRSSRSRDRTTSPFGPSSSRSRSRARLLDPLPEAEASTSTTIPIGLSTGNGTLQEELEADEPDRPAMVRGLLVVTFKGATRVRDVVLKLRGIARTDWPEGIGPRRLDVMEETVLLSSTTTFFSASSSSSSRPPNSLQHGRSASVAPSGPRSLSREPGASGRSSSVMATRDTSAGRWSGSRDIGLNTLHDSLHRHVNARLGPNGAPDVPTRPSLSRIASATGALTAPHSPTQHPSNSTLDLAPPPPPEPNEPSPAYTESPSSSMPATPNRQTSRPSLPHAESTSSTSTTASGTHTPTTSFAPHAHSHLVISQSAFTSPAPSILHHSGNESASSDPEGGPGYASAPVPSSTRSSFERADGVGGATFQSLASTSSSRTRSGTIGAGGGSGGSSTRPSPPPPLTAATHHSSSPARRTGTSRARFSLASLTDSLRGKSKSRARDLSTDTARGGEDGFVNGSGDSVKGKKAASLNSTSRNRAESPDARGFFGGGGRSQSRGRKAGKKKVGAFATHPDDDESSDDEETRARARGWREFRAGTYTYPISIPIPASLPPTISAEFGHVTYELKATVHRAGALTSNLSTTQEVVLVSTPGSEDTEESESIVVERFWETQMKYHVAISGKSFAIGSQIPISIRLNPMAKVKLYRVTVLLEQKTTYYASGRKLTRHEPPKKFPLMRIEMKDPKDPLLPILSDDPNALKDHPLKEFFINPTSSDDSTPSLLDLNGPWHLDSYVKLPDCATKIGFSTIHDKANINVAHVLKIMLRVERGDDNFLDSKGKRKLWDVIIETPLHILSCRCTQNILPPYSSSTASTSFLQSQTSDCGFNHITNTPTRPPQSASHHLSNHLPYHRSSSGNNHASTTIATLEQNLLFARLVAGEETPAGEVPPTYDAVLSGSPSAGTGERARGGDSLERTQSRDSIETTRGLSGGRRLEETTTISSTEEEELERGRSSSVARGRGGG